MAPIRMQHFLDQILARIQHFLARDPREQRLLAMDTVEKGIEAMALFDEVTGRSELLPLIHTMWSPLKPRLSDRDDVVVMKALELVRTMSRWGREFVAGRFVSDVWPVLAAILAGDSQSSSGLDESSELLIPVEETKFSIRFQLRRTALACLSDVCRHSQLPNETFLQIAILGRPYLSDRQAKDLQQAALSLYQVLLSLDPDAVWYLLHELRQSSFQNRSSSPELLPSISFQSSPQSSHLHIAHFNRNTQLLLHLLEDTCKVSSSSSSSSVSQQDR